MGCNLRDGKLDNAHREPENCALQRGGKMAHTNIDLDDNLVAEAMRLTEAKSKKEVVHLGLRELIRMARLRKAREHRGKFHWEGNLRKMREEETHGFVRSSSRHKRSH